jgi:hypothetical protein
MQRQNRKPSALSKLKAKTQPNNAAPSGKAPANEMGNPFATFTEWSSAADEKAYAKLRARGMD